MAAPTITAGPVEFSANGISPDLPTVVAGDRIYIFVENDSQTDGDNPPVPTDYTEHPDSPVNLGGITTLSIYEKIAVGGEGSPIVTDPGNHQIGFCAVVHHADGTPTEELSYNGDAGATDQVSIAGDTTPKNDCALLMVLCQGNDSNQPHLNALTNADLSSITEIADDGTTFGNGGMIAGVKAEKAAAGAYGATTGTTSQNFGTKPYIVLAFAPPSSGQTVNPAGIASEEAFGTPTIQPGSVTVSPAGIASEEAFGTPSVVAGPQLLEPAGIPSEEAFGTPAIVPGVVTISPAGIPSEEAFGVPGVEGGEPPEGDLGAQQFALWLILRGVSF